MSIKTENTKECDKKENVRRNKLQNFEPRRFGIKVHDHSAIIKNTFIQGYHKHGSIVHF